MVDSGRLVPRTGSASHTGFPVPCLPPWESLGSNDDLCLAHDRQGMGWGCKTSAHFLDTREALEPLSELKEGQKLPGKGCDRIPASPVGGMFGVGYNLIMRKS